MPFFQLSSERGSPPLNSFRNVPSFEPCNSRLQAPTVLPMSLYDQSGKLVLYRYSLHANKGILGRADAEIFGDFLCMSLLVHEF
jgi:hypothetical protein